MAVCGSVARVAVCGSVAVCGCVRARRVVQGRAWLTLQYVWGATSWRSDERGHPSCVWQCVRVARVACAACACVLWLGARTPCRAGACVAYIAVVVGYDELAFGRVRSL